MQAIRRTLLSWRGLLAVSLCLNGFLLAYIGTQFSVRPRLAVGTVPPPAMVSRVAEMLPEPDAEILWEAYHRSEERMTAAQKDYRQALIAAAGVLREPKIDEAALRQVVQVARDKRLVIGDMMIEVFLDAFPKMSTRGREKLLEKSLR